MDKITELEGLIQKVGYHLSAQRSITFNELRVIGLRLNEYRDLLYVDSSKVDNTKTEDNE